VYANTSDEDWEEVLARRDDSAWALGGDREPA
jgi:hypothetical protein